MPIVDIIHQQNLPTPDTVNILFLGDGFAEGDRGLFETAIREVADRLLRRIQPFNLKGIRDYISIFSSFEPSPTSGISCESEIDAQGRTLPDFGAGPAIGRLGDKNSRFGLTYGFPPGHLNNALTRYIHPKAGHANTIQNYVRTLTHPTEPAGVTVIPSCWEVPPAGGPAFPAQGKDQGLVIVLVNDDRHGGSGLGHASVISLGNLTMPRIPGGMLFNVTAQLAPGRFDHTPNSPRNTWNRIADVTAHEIGHAHFNLADEYAEEMNAGAAASINPEPNVVSAGEAAGPGGPWANIKWDHPQYPGGPSMISAPVRAHIAAHGPLANNPACGGPNPGIDTSVMLPPGPLRGAMLYPWQLIGLYEGGRREHCGIYRPAGNCKMRALGQWWDHISEYREVNFCYVCKYEIVRKLDPILLQRLAARQSPR